MTVSDGAAGESTSDLHCALRREQLRAHRVQELWLDTQAALVETQEQLQAALRAAQAQSLEADRLQRPLVVRIARLGEEVAQLRASLVEREAAERALAQRMRIARQQLDAPSPLRAAYLRAEGTTIADACRAGALHWLPLIFRSVQAPGHTIGKVEARLVRLGGRVGLQLVKREGMTPALHVWQPDVGTPSERGCEVMSLFPDDTRDEAPLSLMGTADRSFVEALVARIELGLSAANADKDNWLPTAIMLREKLLRQPARWRFDSVRAERGPEPGGLDLCFENVAYGAFRSQRVTVRWRAEATDGVAFEVLAPGRGHDAPIVSAWPLLDSGALAATWPIPFTTRSESRDRQLRHWTALTEPDRQVTRALIGALPAAAQAASAAGLAGTRLSDDIARIEKAMRDADRRAGNSWLRRLSPR